MKISGRMLMIGLLLDVCGGAASLGWAANPAGTGTQAAAESLSHFTVAEGLEVSLFASEPLVRNPTDMDIDERGRIWITEGVNYRSSFQKWGVLQPAGDRIITLERDANGKLKETVFYQDPSINTALGICVLGNKVIVSDAPYVFVLTDTDGCGRADRRELLFSGVGGKDHDHGIHTFVFGPDGKLYFNMGNEGKHLFQPLNREVPLHGAIDKVPQKPVVDLEGNEVNDQGKPYRNGMVFRCNLDGSEVETLGWNFRNNYEVCVDSFGTLWQSDNDDDGNRGCRINYVMEHGNFGFADEMTGDAWSRAWDKAKAKGEAESEKIYYEWHQHDPGVVPDLLHTGSGSPTGIMVYEGKLLPEPFRNQIIHCDAGPRVVRAYPAHTVGAGFGAGTTDILTTTDNWFRPVDVCAAPDGSLYLADWNDASVGGHYMADQKLETMTGRIYRVAPIGSRPEVTKWNLRTAAGCVQALQSPNLSARYLAWTTLHAMKDGAARPLLKLWQGKDPRLRARALQLLARIPGRGQKYVKLAIKDADPDLRITGLRIARELNLELLPLVKTLAQDPSAAVRRECAIALRHQTSPPAAGLWAELARQYDGRDRWYLEALGIGAESQWDFFLAAWLQAVGDQWDSPAGREILWRSRAKTTPALLARIIREPNRTVPECDHYFRSFDFIPGPEKEAALVELLTVPSAKAAAPSADQSREIGLEALSRLKGIDLETHPTVKAAAVKMLEGLHGNPQFVEIVRDFKIKDQEPGLLEIATQATASPAGTDAARLILKADKIDLLQTSLASSNAVNLIRALGNTGEKGVVPLLKPLVTDSAHELPLRQEAVRALSKVQEGVSALLELARTRKLPEDLKRLASSELNQVRWDDLKAQAAQLLPVLQDRQQHTLPSIAELAKPKGDPVKGAAVFRSDVVSCAKCHQVNGEGVDFGPNLSEIGNKLGKEALYESILDPSAGIASGYEAWQIELKDGGEAYGLKVSETEDELSIKAVGGIVSRYKKSEISERTQQKLSIMPSGLEKTMTLEELSDLVEYLYALKKAVPVR